MLISFAVENFRSIASRQELSMLAQPLRGREEELGNVYEDPKYGYKILKSAVIYGANASGKSNVVKAMDTMALLVLKSIDLKIHHPIPSDPFQFLPEKKAASTRFEIVFIAEDKTLYEYSFEFTAEGVYQEMLYSWPKGRKTVCFERTKREVKFGAGFKGDKKVLRDTLLHNHLLLTKAANSNYESALPVYNFFAHRFKIVFDPLRLTESRNMAFINPKSQKQIRDFLLSADTSISDLEVRPDESAFDTARSFNENALTYNKQQRLEVYVAHKTGADRVTWPLINESVGTQKLFSLAGPLINALSTGIVFVVDELTSSLHPEICRFIVDKFHFNSESYPAQLIFTTHDTSIMTSEIFRRDQIWFTEKTKSQETLLFSLASFDRNVVRISTPYDRWYLSGKFGAVPIVSNWIDEVS